MADVDWVQAVNWHAPTSGLFDTEALCGATALTEPEYRLRLHADHQHVTCVKCRELLLGFTP